MNATTFNETEANALAEAINQVSSSQPATEAAKLIQLALARAPQHPLVLNAAAGHYLRRDDARRAHELYERAIALDPRSKVLRLNLANACRALGDSVGEEAALQQALSIEPRYVLALLQKAALFERLGKSQDAFIAFEAALDSVASGAPAPQQAAPALKHAQEVVSASRVELDKFLTQEIAAIRKQHAAADQQRYEACQDLYLRKRRIYHSDPKEILFPYLPALEFFKREDFPWLDALEAATDDIAGEALAAFHGARPEFRPYVDFPPGTPVDQWGPLNHSTDWSVYSLWHDGDLIDAHAQKCPKTAQILREPPLCDIPGYAPGAFFSVLKPRTRLPPHTGTTNTRSIVHLPLVVPEGCTFRVGSQVRTWQKGKAWVFDDTIEHEAHNESGEIRIILIFDIWNPFLSIAERDLVRALTVGIGRYYGSAAPVLGSR
jgi:aspartyl/asparaginyl beta-hydroxylase (cupin superfamily)